MNDLEDLPEIDIMQHFPSLVLNVLIYSHIYYKRYCSVIDIKHIHKVHTVTNSQGANSYHPNNLL